MKNILKGPVTSCIVGLCKARNRNFKGHCHCLHVRSGPSRSELAKNLDSLYARDIFSQVKKGTSCPQRTEVRGETLPEGKLPDAKNTLGLEQGGEGQANRGALFNLANAMVIFAGTIM